MEIGEKPTAHSFAQAGKNKYQRDQADNNNVAGQHVGKQTYDQRERLCENTQDLHRDHDELDTMRHRRTRKYGPSNACWR